MQLGDPGSKKSKQIIGGIIGALILLFVIAFRKEWMWVFGVTPAPDDATGVLPPGPFLFFNCLVGFLLVFLFWNALLSFQTLLPITNFLRNPLVCLMEAYRTSFHLLLHIFGRHGPAVAVTNGKANTTAEDISREGRRGVVVIDFNSAVVLEERQPPPGLGRLFSRIFDLILEALLLADASESPRVCGPGIVFTHPRERIRGVVDLRKQFRLESNIRCYTREGIELYGSILSMFTIGQDPDILQVTYDGEMRPENLRIVSFEDRQGAFKRVTGFANDLDDADRMEIHNFAMLENPFQEDSRPIYQTFTTLPDTSRQVFNRERVFSAVYAQARNSKQEILPWYELPVRVAASLYREQLLQINYDDLYDIREEQPRFPLPEYKSTMRIAMRNNGILAFRLVQNASGTSLIRGRVYRDTDLLVSQVRQLRNSKTLRDRGIKIIFSSFGDLFPVNEIIKQQRLNTWETPWERELALNLANHGLDALREGSRAHILAQQDLWRSLRQLFDQHEYTDEALALRILQALEQAAAEPKTQALLPEKAIDMLRHMQLMLLPPEPTQPPVRQPQSQQGGGGSV